MPLLGQLARQKAGMIFQEISIQQPISLSMNHRCLGVQTVMIKLLPWVTCLPLRLYHHWFPAKIWTENYFSFLIIKIQARLIPLTWR